MRHPPERGLQHALYGGSCCTTCCCCCCCCCAHSVGGVVGAFVAQEVAIRAYGVSNRRTTSPARFYWLAVLVTTASVVLIGKIWFGLVAVAFALPLIQLVASLWTFFYILGAFRESERSTAWRILAWTTAGSLLGALAGAVVIWRLFLAAK